MISGLEPRSESCGAAEIHLILAKPHRKAFWKQGHSR